MPELPFVLRAALLSEIQLLPPIEEAADALFPPGRLPEEAGTRTPEELLLSLRQGLLYVAVVDDRVVGFAASLPRAAFLHLHQVSVLPGYGRRGIGRALVEVMLQECSKRRLSGVTLNTFRDIPWNAPFYASLGFEPIPDDELHPAQRASMEQAAALGMEDRVAMVHRLGSSMRQTESKAS